MSEQLKNRTNDRSPALDVIRCVACFGVIAAHFLLNNGFYKIDVGTSGRMTVMVFYRSCFMYCVPLFIILSGYLLCNKPISMKFYGKIGKTYFIYVVASLFCLFGYPFLYTHLHGILGLPAKEFAALRFFDDVLLNILNFTAAPYSWFVEMYLGLFLMIPFLGLLYRSIQTRRQKHILLLIGIVLTSLPTVINVYDFGQIIPEWWIRLYPVSYFFIGCYLREYRIRIRPWKALLLILATVALSGLFCLWRVDGGQYTSGASWNARYSIFNVVYSVLVFLLFQNIDYGRMPRFLRTLFTRISELTLGAYLVSWVFDKLFYAVLNDRVPKVWMRLEYCVIIVPLVFVCSLCVSAVIRLLYRLLDALIVRVRSTTGRKNSEKGPAD